MHHRVAFALVALSALFWIAAVSACVPASPRERNRDRDRDGTPAIRPCITGTECLANEVCLDLQCRAACDDTAPCELGNCVDGLCIVDEETLCVPNEIGCVDSSTAFVCNGDGSAREEAACRSDQICLEGSCRTQVCPAATSSCSGSALVVCNATGTDSTVESCDSACTEGGFGCTCTEGACAARTCAPASSRCVGNASQRCDGQGLAFGPLEDCGTDSCVAGRCITETCTAGSTFCSGSTLLTCQTDGFGFTETACAQACSGGDGVAACTDQICTPLQQSCRDDATLLVCNANGTAELTQRCASDEVCELGACVQTACVPECGARTCGVDPICGTSCGSCAGTCSSDGTCQAPTGPVMTVELSWTPTTQDMDLSLSRDPSSSSMCAVDTCLFSTCKSGDADRPDWDGTGTASAGDPLLDVADVVTANPEKIVLTLPNGAQRYRVGADNFGPVAQGGATAATTATVVVKLGGSVVGTQVRSVPVNTQWDGVVLTWNGTSMGLADDAGLVDAFQCDTLPGGGGTACTVDTDCAPGQGCVFDQFGIFGTCVDVGCTANGDCGGGQLCNANHACVNGPLLGWKGQCGSDDGLCRVGFHCDFFSQLCEEACSPTVCTGPNVAGCCLVTGGDICTPDALIGVSGNCN